MIRVAVVEDDKSQASLLESMLTRYGQEKNQAFAVDTFYSGVDLLDGYNGSYDIILLDIEMPFINGIDVAKKIRKADKSVVLIFVTNMAQYAINGYEVNASGFLVKPIAYFGLKMTLGNAINFVASKEASDIVINTRQGVKVLSSTDVQYVESVKHDLVYHTAAGEIRCRGTLKEIENELLKLNFIRSSSCYIINLKYVRGIENGMIELPKCSLPVSRERKKDITNAFMRYLGGKRNVWDYSEYSKG